MPFAALVATFTCLSNAAIPAGAGRVVPAFPALNSGRLLWMARDLRRGDIFAGADSGTHWSAAESGASCPEGWRLPRDRDWAGLAVRFRRRLDFEDGYFWSAEGHLARDVWLRESLVGTGLLLEETQREPDPPPDSALIRCVRDQAATTGR